MGFVDHCSNNKTKHPIGNAGITNVEGNFGRGDVVSLLGENGQEFARGLTNYDSQTAARLKGKRLADVPSDPSGLPYDEIIHRDNLLVFGPDSESQPRPG